MKIRPSRIFQFLLGSALGLGIMGAAILGVGYLIVQQLTAPPPRPKFPNDNVVTTPGPDQPKPPAKPTASPTPSPAASASPMLPAGSYQATVSYPGGLSVRDSPNGSRIGGVDFQEKLVVLETSSDGNWQKIRSETSGLEGWIKAGNVDKVQ